jgi:hypothetical protein
MTHWVVVSVVPLGGKRTSPGVMVVHGQGQGEGSQGQEEEREEKWGHGENGLGVEGGGRGDTAGSLEAGQAL